jgi:hypothetical protein
MGKQMEILRKGDKQFFITKSGLVIPEKLNKSGKTEM